MFNGLANSTVQTGFESVNLTNYVQTNSIGADMTALTAGGGTLTGTAYADTLRGGAGIDNLTGGAGDDTITTGGGADIVLGGDGNDTITGGDAADTITGGAGVDTITTGTGADKIFAAGVGESVAASANTLANTVAATNTLTFGSGVDVITDFNKGTDLLYKAGTAASDSTNVAAINAIYGVAKTVTISAADDAYVVYGSYATTTGVFTIQDGFDATAGHNDAFVAFGVSNSTLTAATETGGTILTDLNAALEVTDLIYT
jgi:Ca2+-binding RTX toxin-like protein